MIKGLRMLQSLFFNVQCLLLDDGDHVDLHAGSLRHVAGLKGGPGGLDGPRGEVARVDAVHGLEVGQGAEDHLGADHVAARRVE